MRGGRQLLFSVKIRRTVWPYILGQSESKVKEITGNLGFFSFKTANNIIIVKTNAGEHDKTCFTQTCSSKCCHKRKRGTTLL